MGKKGKHSQLHPTAPPSALHFLPLAMMEPTLERKKKEKTPCSLPMSSPPPGDDSHHISLYWRRGDELEVKNWEGSKMNRADLEPQGKFDLIA